MKNYLTRWFAVLALLALAAPAVPSSAATPSQIIVSTSADAKAALPKLVPGQTLIFADGSYNLGKITLKQQATWTAPIRIAAEHTGQATFTNSTAFVFQSAAYMTLAGCVFATTETAPVLIQGSHHIRVTRNTLRVGEARRTSGSALVWVNIVANGTVNSHDNRIDHNLMEGKQAIGQVVGIGGITSPYCEIASDIRIDHNYFRNVGPRISNGMETIRAGLSWLTLSSGRIIIENNLFDACDGDPEVVSIKNCDTIVRNNTFIRCQGGVCLRHGNRNEVSGNFFFGEKKTDTRGVRFYGDDHKIFNNYFQDLSGPVLEIAAGDVEYPPDVQMPRDEAILVKHVRPRRISIVFNSFVNNGQPISIGSGTFPAQDVVLANNLSSGCDKTAITGTPAQDTLWLGNIIYPGAGKTLGVTLTSGQVNVVDPQLTLDGNLWRPAAGSPARNAAQGSFIYVTTDMDGQSRGDVKDVGADQRSTLPISNRPLTPDDVGPASPDDPQTAVREWKSFK